MTSENVFKEQAYTNLMICIILKDTTYRLKICKTSLYNISGKRVGSAYTCRARGPGLNSSLEQNSAH